MPNPLLACAAGALAALVSACAAPQQGTWTAHRDPRGFSLQLPRGWTVAPDAKSGRIDVTGPRAERLVVWPVFVPGPLDAHSAVPVLARLAASSGIDLPWGPPRPAGSAGVRMAGRGAGRVATAAFAWVPSPKGSAGFFYAAAAPEAAYRDSQEAFAAILASFRLAGAAASAPAPAAVQYTRWTDPRESAFSLEVPAGWTATGGLFRFAPVDTRGAWQAASPDGRIRITGGDADLPTFTEPNQMLAMTGFREGAWYSPGYGVRMLVRRFTPAAAFVQEYIASRVAQGAAALAFADRRDRTADAAGLNALYARFQAYGASLHLTAGDAAFTCQRNGEPMAGYYFAGVLRTQTAGMQGGLWHVDHLFGFLAPQAQAGQAHAILEHMLASIQVNPQWAAMQSKVTAESSRIVSQTHNEISNIISSTYWNRQATMDELSRRRSNVTLGVVDVIDPATGRQIKVENSANYYWVDNQGAIVGTNTYTRPDIDFREMIELP